MNNNENTQKIKLYLSYLRDVSRKIISRSGFEKALLDKSKNNPSFTLQIDKFYSIIRKNNPKYSHYDTYYTYLERNQDKKLFIGFHAIAGTKNRLFAAPLLFAECEIIKEDNGDLLIEIDYSTLSINYDLFSIIMGNFDILDDEEIDISYEKETRLFEEIEKEIISFTDYDKINYFGIRIYNSCKNEFEQFNDIKEFDSNNYNFEYEKQLFNSRYANRKNTNIKSVFDSDLCFIKANHLFISRIPDQLSTYEALKKLILEIGEEFKNPILEKLLINSITDSKVSIKTDDNNWEIEAVVRDRLPISLSNNQIGALKNAWSNEISYVQGPPGTGKSHTITAILLSAIFLDKKVLVVSQKVPALEVVNDKIRPYLDDEIQGIVYFDKDSRIKIREYLKKLLNISYNKINLQDQIKTIQGDLETKEKELKQLLNALKTDEENLKGILKFQYEFKEENDKFLRKRDNLEYKYSVRFDTEYKFKRIKKQKSYCNILSYIEKIQNDSQKNLITELFRKKLKNHFITHLKVNQDWLKDSIFYDFCKDFINLLTIYTNTQYLLNKINRELNLLRKDIDSKKKYIHELQKKILKLKYKVSILRKLTKREYIDELEKFSKMLFNTRASLIAEKMKDIDFNIILEILPFWSAEIRNLGNLFPLNQGIFDLIVVDESSQVNLAEILPVFYRGGKICILGDHNQLSLNSTGVNFQLSKRFDNLTWNKYKCGNLTYETARKRNLTVMYSSILDFIRSEYNNTSLREVMLDEHYRSLPALAQYTNKQFYEGNLKIMTENPYNISLKCFIPIKVSGQRDSKNKTINTEAKRVVEIISKLISSPIEQSHTFETFQHSEYFKKEKFTIGVISMIRNQCELISDILNELLGTDIIEKYKILIGTPEEFQGNEKDIIIFSLCLDSDSVHSYSFYQNKNRLNVATSRAKYLTYFVYSAIPRTFDKIINYLKYFKGYVSEDELIDSSKTITETEYNPITWKFDHNSYESDFERQVYYYLEKYIQNRSNSYVIKIFNQVESCGQKRLDFVLYNENNNKSVAVEVDGRYHFVKDGIKNNYNVDHIERIELLKRAGWNIINTQYYKWYNNGWLSGHKDNVLKEELIRIVNEIDRFLGIEK